MRFDTLRSARIVNLFFLKDYLHGLAGSTDPFLPWHLVHCQTCKLKSHFNFLKALVTSGPALSLGHNCSFHTLWCQKAYSPSNSHLNLIHLSAIMCYSRCLDEWESKSTQGIAETNRAAFRYQYTTAEPNVCICSVCTYRHTIFWMLGS